MSTITIDIRSFVIPNGEPAETCPICFEDDMTEGLEHRVSDTVAHRFHTDCAERCVREHGNCAICRGRVTSVNGVITAAAADAQIRQIIDDIFATAGIEALPLYLALMYAVAAADVAQIRQTIYDIIATARREVVPHYIALVNTVAPERFNADGSVATDLIEIEEVAQQVRILLAARLAQLDQLDAEYAASMRGRVSSAVSSAATNIAAFARNHSTALKAGVAVACAGAGAYMYPGAVAAASEAATSAVSSAAASVVDTLQPLAITLCTQVLLLQLLKLLHQLVHMS